MEHGRGIPQASCSFYNDGEELHATRKLLSEVDIAGRVITLDALLTTFESVELILDAEADYMLTLKDNTCLQLGKAQKMKWYSSRVRHYTKQLTKAHGRIEQRHIQVLEVNAPHKFEFKQVRQVYRIDRDREQVKDADNGTRETVYGITSVEVERADAEQLLKWNRGHTIQTIRWCVWMRRRGN